MDTTPRRITISTSMNCHGIPNHPPFCWTCGRTSLQLCHTWKLVTLRIIRHSTRTRRQVQVQEDLPSVHEVVQTWTAPLHRLFDQIRIILDPIDPFLFNILYRDSAANIFFGRGGYGIFEVEREEREDGIRMKDCFHISHHMGEHFTDTGENEWIREWSRERRERRERRFRRRLARLLEDRQQQGAYYVPSYQHNWQNDLWNQGSPW